VVSELARAYAYCQRLAREHYENFPVASRLLPPEMRPAIAAIYAFARRADDYADEPGLEDTERLRLLDEWEQRLLRAKAGTRSGAGDDDDLIFVALADAMRRHALPEYLFQDLLSAFRQDVVKHRYETWDEVLDYCRRSANPVGRLVLRVAGYDHPGLDRQSDAICTALQLTNFWQDFGRDWAHGRLYVPVEECARAGAQEAQLARGTMPKEWRSALRAATGRTRALFDAGRPLCDTVTGRLRHELRFTWLGGTRVLEKVERLQFDVLARRPKLGLGDGPVLLWRAARWNPRAS
jgi:squalene synthase HpnC